MATHERIPLFPLGIVLFPLEVLPLHIFEDRYKKMIRYCLSEEADFGIIGLEGEEIAPVGCMARIRSVIRENEDDTIDIETIGLTRFRVASLYDDQPYATADIVPVTDRDEPVVATERERLVAQHMKLMELLGESIRPSAYAEEHLLSFRIGASSGLDFSQRQQLLEIDSEAARITRLVQHLSALIPLVQSARERREKVQSNGHFH